LGHAVQPGQPVDAAAQARVELVAVLPVAGNWYGSEPWLHSSSGASR
jgi:hypothetical protein